MGDSGSRHRCTGWCVCLVFATSACTTLSGLSGGTDASSDAADEAAADDGGDGGGGGDGALGVCAPGLTRACGTNGSQTCSPAGTWCNCQHDSATCTGTVGGWTACRGNGCSVCVEKSNDYPCYFKNHPDCVPDTTCNNTFFQCNSKCPVATIEDKCTCSASGTWPACGGQGCAVCAEQVKDYACYFVNHAGCSSSSTCGGQYTNCSLNCPPPVPTDTGSLQ